MTRPITTPTEPPDALLDRVERRIAGRSVAGELLDLIGAQRDDAIFMEAVIGQLRLATIGPPAEPPPPTHEPIARLGATQMEFGQYMGQTLDEVPRDYLDWLCATQEDFYRVLRAYLKHPDLESRRRGVER
jgi:hypothetical protein